jgi:hypothetical protein
MLESPWHTYSVQDLWGFSIIPLLYNLKHKPPRVLGGL